MSVPYDKATFGELLREHRRTAGLTQDSLAQLSGVSLRTIQDLEAGTVNPRRATLQRLVDALTLSDQDRQELERLAAPIPRRRHAGEHDADPTPINRFTIVPVPTEPDDGHDREVAPNTVSGSARTNVPWPVSSLLGREADLASIRALITVDHQRLVTLTGVGGAGKTRLAIQVAAELLDEIDDGVWFIELAPVSSPSLVPRIVAGVLGVHEAGNTPIIEVLRSYLQKKRLLLILDNCEHLITACADLAEQLLKGCPSLSILATSREPLQIGGERRWQVRALAIPSFGNTDSPEVVGGAASVRLFVDRARAIDAEFCLDASNALAVAQVCARVDGIPLAIELAASRIGVLTADQIAERLDDSFRLLAGGNRVASTRQQTMEATLDWSYELLSSDERAAFRALSTFAGGFDLEAADAVAGVGSTETDLDRPSGTAPSVGNQGSAALTLDVLSGLVDKSLVVADRTPRGRRFRLLEPVRQYAALALVRGGESERARAHHADYYAALARRAAPLLRGPDQIAWLRRLELERDNLRAALAWTVEHGTVDAGRQLAISLTGYWSARGHLAEGRRWLQTMLAASDDATSSPALRMRLLMETGVMAKWQGDLAESRRLLAESLTAARELADRRSEAEVLIWLSSVYWQMDDVEIGRSLGEESIRLSHEVADEALLALAYIVFASGRRAVRDVVRAVSTAEEGLRRFQALGDHRFVASSMTELGLSLLMAGDLDRAEPVIRQCVHVHRAVGERRYVIYALLGLSELYQRKGELRQAAILLRAADVQRESIGMRYSPFNRATAQRLHDSLRQSLTPSVFDAVYEVAATMSLDQVLAEIDTAS